jgi:hypothetical protein
VPILKIPKDLRLVDHRVTHNKTFLVIRKLWFSYAKHFMLLVSSCRNSAYEGLVNVNYWEINNTIFRFCCLEEQQNYYRLLSRFPFREECVYGAQCKVFLDRRNN